MLDGRAMRRTPCDCAGDARGSLFCYPWATVRLPFASISTTTLSDRFTLSPGLTAWFDRMSAANVMPLWRLPRFVTRSELDVY